MAMKFIGAFRIKLKELVGELANLAGFPGFVLECDYEAGICQAHIRVRKGCLFTVITVNGLDIYFCRLTGSIDGVGFNPTSDCMLGQVAGSIDPVSPPVYRKGNTRIENQ